MGELDDSDVTIAYEDPAELPVDPEETGEPADTAIVVDELPDEVDEELADPEEGLEPELSSEEEPDESPWVRRSSRQRSAPQRFTYDTVGGNPTMASVEGVLASLESCVWLR